MTTYYVGIDPGASGGIGILTYEGKILRCVSAFKMPTTDEALWDELSMLPSRNQCRVVLEKVGGYISATDGGFVAGGSAMFNFGWNCGMLKAYLIALGYKQGEDLHLIPAANWQKALGVSPRIKARKAGRKGPAVVGETRTEFKNRLKQLAQELFPDTPVTLKTSDALLLARYCYLRFSAPDKV